MATKSGLLSAFSTALSIVISKAKVITANTLVVDNLYPTSVTDSHVTETYTTKAGTNLQYTVRIMKQGNCPMIQVSITNTTFSAQLPQNVFTWKDSEFKPKSGVNDFTVQAWSNANRISVFINNSVLSITSAIPALTTYKFEFTPYIAQD